MTQTKTKKALLMSVLSMVLCVAMLVGMTFAWFTDTASTAVNKIQAGNLKVDLVGIDGETLVGKTLNWQKADEHAGEEVLWEPGVTYNLEPFKIVNKGNLALKYKVEITGLSGDAKLLEAIDFTIAKGTAESQNLEDFEGKLLPEASQLSVDGAEVKETAWYTITGKMRTNAGNEYQGLSIDGIGITVYATQLDAEFDSTGNDYDQNATYLNEDKDHNILIGTAGDLEYFAKHIDEYEGKTVKLTSNIDLQKKVWTPMVGNRITFDGNNHTIKNLNATGEKNVGLFGTATNCTIKNLTIDGATVTGINHVAALAGDALCATIENCTVKNATVTTQVKNNDDGDKAGAIAGYLSAEPNASVKGCKVEGCTIAGYRDIGGLVGYANSAAVITDNTVESTQIINDRSINYKNYTTDNEFDANEIVGEYNNGTLDSSNTYNGVTISKKVPAANNTEFNNIIVTAKNGDIIVLNYDITELDLPANVTIADGITIDGQGKFSISRNAWMALSNLSIEIQNAQMG